MKHGKTKKKKKPKKTGTTYGNMRQDQGDSSWGPSICIVDTYTIRWMAPQPIQQLLIHHPLTCPPSYLLTHSLTHSLIYTSIHGTETKVVTVSQQGLCLILLLSYNYHCLSCYWYKVWCRKHTGRKKYQGKVNYKELLDHWVSRLGLMV